MIVLTAGKLRLSISDDGRQIAWTADGLPLRVNEGADLWRAFFDDGYLREMCVRSSEQPYCQAEKTDENHAVLRYSRLVEETGREFDLTLTVYITVTVSTYPGFETYAVIENRDKARLNELMLPMIDMETACDTDRAKDVMYVVEGFGSYRPNPWEYYKGSHTEYMGADHKQVWCGYSYPSLCSMPWFGLQTGGHFLYLGKQDNRCETQLMDIGVAPRGCKDQLIMTTSLLPYAEAGETVETIHTFVSLNEGDWRTGSDIYGNFARANWYTPPVFPEWVKHMTGWQRIILRHQYGEILFTYADLPRVYREGLKAGLDTLMVFGWWKGRFDNGYPIYEIDEELGGEEGLRAAIDEIHAMGGRVILYTNGQLIDVATDFYKEKGHRLCRIDIDGNPYMDHYRFSNEGISLRAFGHKSFVTACAGTPEWIDLQTKHTDYKFSLGADSAFFDQLGGNFPNPCFCKDHPHGNRAAAEEEGRLNCMKAIFEHCPEGGAIGTEKVMDVLLPYLHYVHGAMNGPIYWGPSNPVPEMLLRTFPDTVHTNRFVHDEKPGTDEALKHAFIYGFRYDICAFRGRTGISSLPRLTEMVKRLVDLREQYAEFFYEGKFVCDTDVVLPAGVLKGEFLAADNIRRMVTLWNNNTDAVTLDVAGKSVTVPGKDVACVVLDGTN